MGYKGYIGAFVPADYASPCPGFNCGKTTPGGGRGSRSPSAHSLLFDSYRLQHLSADLHTIQTDPS